MNVDTYLNYYDINDSSDEEYEILENNMKGGVMLDEGGYGCVFYPSLNCKTGKENINKEFISKVQIDTPVATNEYNIGKIIQKISNYNKYFSPIIQKCPIGISKINETNIEKCNILKNNNKNIVMMKSNYIPNELFLHYFNSIEKKHKINSFIYFYKYLLNSLELLVKNKIIHYDLKGNNILVDINQKIPIIIDFGLSINLNELNKLNVKNKLIYSSTYVLMPPEMMYLSYLYRVNKNPSRDEIINMANESFETLKKYILEKYYSNDFIKKYKILHRESLLRYQNINREKMYENIFENKLWKTIDNYSLSILYLRLFEVLFKQYNNGFIINFSKLLLNNIHPYPEKRLNLEKTKEAIENIFLNEINLDQLLNFVR